MSVGAGWVGVEFVGICGLGIRRRGESYSGRVFHTELELPYGYEAALDSPNRNRFTRIAT